MMLDCWQENPDARPTFPSLRDILRGMEKNHVVSITLHPCINIPQLNDQIKDYHNAIFKTY